jgi:hypothetical protein
VLFHVSVRLHTGSWAQELLQHFNWELFDHPPYNPDLALSDYHMFTYLENWFGSQFFNSNEKLMEGVKMQPSSQPVDIFDKGIQKLTPQYDKCLSSGSYYIKKWQLCTYFCIKYFFLIASFFNSSPEATF